MFSSETESLWILSFEFCFKDELVDLAFGQIDLVSCNCDAFWVTSSCVLCIDFKDSIDIDVEVDVNLICISSANFNF